MNSSNANVNPSMDACEIIPNDSQRQSSQFLSGAMHEVSNSQMDLMCQTFSHEVSEMLLESQRIQLENKLKTLTEKLESIAKTPCHNDQTQIAKENRIDELNDRFTQSQNHLKKLNDAQQEAIHLLSEREECDPISEYIANKTGQDATSLELSEKVASLMKTVNYLEKKQNEKETLKKKLEKQAIKDTETINKLKEQLMKDKQEWDNEISLAEQEESKLRGDLDYWNEEYEHLVKSHSELLAIVQSKEEANDSMINQMMELNCHLQAERNKITSTELNSLYDEPIENLIKLEIDEQNELTRKRCELNSLKDISAKETNSDSSAEMIKPMKDKINTMKSEKIIAGQIISEKDKLKESLITQITNENKKRSTYRMELQQERTRLGKLSFTLRQLRVEYHQLMMRRFKLDQLTGVELHPGNSCAASASLAAENVTSVNLNKAATNQNPSGVTSTTNQSDVFSVNDWNVPPSDKSDIPSTSSPK